MTRTLAFAASIAMLVSLSGQAFAGAVTSKAPHQPTSQAFNSFNQATIAPASDAHRYHGGPKSSI